MTTADVVIVGGGIYGTAVSLHLARAGMSVLLLERSRVASGASGGPGFRGVRASDRDLRELPLVRMAADIWPRLEVELGRDAGFRRVGGLCVFESQTSSDPAALARIAAMVDVQNAHGIPTELVDGDRARELEPGLGPAITGAVWTPLDGVGDHTRTTRAFAAAAGGEGVDVREGVEAVAIAARGEAPGGQVRTASGETHHAAAAVVVLANSYTPALLGDSFGLRLPTWRYNPQATVVRPRAEFVLRRLVNHFTRPFSAKSVADGVMLTGGGRGHWDEGDDLGTPDPAAAAASTAEAPLMVPALAGAEIVLVDASRVESMAVDDVPIIDKVPAAPSVFFGCGWSGHGYAIAPAVAPLLARWVITGERPAVLAPFALARLIGS